MLAELKKGAMMDEDKTGLAACFQITVGHCLLLCAFFKTLHLLSRYPFPEEHST